MRGLLRSRWLVTTLLIAACSERASAQSKRSDSGARQAASRFSGCYRLSDSTTSYVLRLDTLRSGKQWRAQRIQPLTTNRAGDSWSWLPIDSSHFRVAWAGIDGSMEYAVTGVGDTLATVQSIYSASVPKVTRLSATAKRVKCVERTS